MDILFMLIFLAQAGFLGFLGFYCFNEASDCDALNERFGTMDFDKHKRGFIGCGIVCFVIALVPLFMAVSALFAAFA